jgi:hypothetical protein
MSEVQYTDTRQRSGDVRVGKRCRFTFADLLNFDYGVFPKNLALRVFQPLLGSERTAGGDPGVGKRLLKAFRVPLRDGSGE